MCHCWADTREELFAMMDQIGIPLKWFQRPYGDCEFGMNASWEHFDISLSKKTLAIRNGAIELDMRTMAEHANRQIFIKAVSRQQWDVAGRALRFMTLAAKRI